MQSLSDLLKQKPTNTKIPFFQTHSFSLNFVKYAQNWCMLNSSANGIFVKC